MRIRGSNNPEALVASFPGNATGTNNPKALVARVPGNATGTPPANPQAAREVGNALCVRHVLYTSVVGASLEQSWEQVRTLGPVLAAGEK